MINNLSQHWESERIFFLSKKATIIGPMWLLNDLKGGVGDEIFILSLPSGVWRLTWEGARPKAAAPSGSSGVLER